MTGFQENAQNPNFLHLIPLIPGLRFFFKVPLLTLHIMQNFRKTNGRPLRYSKMYGQMNRQTGAITMDTIELNLRSNRKNLVWLKTCIAKADY